MTFHIFDLLRAALALGGGLAIGYGFGLVQAAAARRYEKRQQNGRFNNAWAVMPGSATRVAMLLAVLGLIQVICPVLFVDGVQWWMSAGVTAGYGVQLFNQLRFRRSVGRLA